MIDNNNTGDNNKKEKKKKKKKSKSKDVDSSNYDYDAVQQILIDICKEMKDVKESIQESGLTKTSENNIESNRHHDLLSQLENQMGMLQQNIKQLDDAIESKATPEQIDNLIRIRAVQKIIKSITEDKDKTVAIYEEHVKRGTAEIERLRQDLLYERKEVIALRAELETLRSERTRMATAEATSAIKPVNNICINTNGSVGGDSDIESAATGQQQQPYAKYINGIMSNGGGSSVRRGSLLLDGELFDDMTLDTKGSYETVAYEMKSLKKRIIHMKKKLSVAQLEAKETGGLRVEVERLRVTCENEKMASQSKDETIQRLEDQIQELLRLSPAVESASSITSQSLKIPKKTKWWDI
jgi:hypothetical protein